MHWRYVYSETSAVVKMNLEEAFSLIIPYQKQWERKNENVDKKIINAKAAVVFNEMCIKENMFLNYTVVYMHKHNVYRYIYTYI